MRIRLIILLCFIGMDLVAQTDSSLLLRPERLTGEDILFRDEGQKKLRAQSGTRTEEEVDQLPFTLWVVTSEDILRNGFVTLGDVLRAAPGVRVSQPGNMLEGETFMLRGLSGNQYVKVMINDVPIKPSAAKGMPIGAQLPIRQAERIEVLFGPAAAIFGDEACAGVVNIILKETERPIFTQADLAFGNLGYNSLDLMLGGKLFKDQKVFRFSLYGSSTVRQRTDIFYDDRLFTTKNYLPLGLDSTLYQLNANYRPREPGDSIARSAQIPHESRLLGINLTWRGINFNYNRMQRSDHSALGLSPLAASYATPSGRITEQIETFAIRFQKRRRYRTATNTLSLVRYQVGDNSNFTPVFDRLSTALYYSKQAGIQSEAERQAVLNDIYTRFASGERYFSANGLDFRFESRINASLNPNLYLDAGIQLNIGGGVPPMGYFSGPLEPNLIGESTPNNPKPFSYAADASLNLNPFAQLHWHTKKATVIGGVAFNVAGHSTPVIAPRLALQYRLDSTWTLRASYAEGFRRPPVFARVNTYSIDATAAPEVKAAYHNVDKTERFRSAEAGLHRYKQGYTTDVLFFYQEARHLVRDGYLYQRDSFWRYGFENTPGLAMSMWGLQARLGNDLLDFDLNKGKTKGGQVTLRADLYFQYTRGREWFGYGLPATSDVRNFPRWMSQIRMSLRGAKWAFVMTSNRQNKILSSAVVYRDFFQRQPEANYYPAYRSWDAMLRLYLSKNFLLYLHVQNLFNRHYAGIDATGTPDDLLYNPQQGRTLRFGVNYNMN